jgi:hypothetical protein
VSADVTERLYRLLPAIYRIRDEEQGGPLRALLAVIAEQVAVLHEDLAQRYDDHFVETCADWVVAYIGDLVGSPPLFDAGRIRQPETAAARFGDLTGPRLLPEVAQRGRADVAKTISYRRRKATRPMLEELARDVTGWAAHAVEFFERLIWAQCVRNHLRPASHACPDLRRVEPLGRVDGPFETAGHAVDVRRIGQLDGWHNLRNVGFFLWRLRSYEIVATAARRVGGPGDFRYHVSPLGQPAPLFSRWRPRGDASGVAAERHVPGPIRPAAFYEDLRAYHALPLPRPGVTDFYGLFGGFASASMPPAPDRSLLVVRDGVPVPPDDVRCMDLGVWAQPSDPVVGVDVRLGRLAFGAGFEPAESVEVCHHGGFSADLGGGTYPRRSWLVRTALPDLRIAVDQGGATPGSVTSLGAALAAWAAAGKPNTVVSIADNRTYEEAVTIEPAADRWLVIEAADRRRPHLRLTGPLQVTGDHPEASLTLSGLLVEGVVRVTGSLGRLRLLHTTLVPGASLTADGLPATTDPSLLAEEGGPGAPLNERLDVEIAFSITGPLRIPAHARGLTVLDSIVDGVGTAAIAGPGAPDRPGPPAWLERSTVFGASALTQLTLASEVIFTAPARVERRHEGCVRFSFVPRDARVPRRYRCQPDLEIAARIEALEEEGGAPLDDAARGAVAEAVGRWLVPAFTSTRYGQPAYAQLHLACPGPIRTGAEDGAEMGAFCHLKQPQREANLHLRLREYLPFGLEPGLIYVT